MEIIEKAYADHAEMAATGKLHGLTPFEANSIWFILNDLNKGDTSGTLTEKIANWFSKRGFSVIKSGVGWTIGV